MQVRTVSPSGPVHSGGFQKLLEPSAWSRLAPAVRARFAKELARDEIRIFQGEIVETNHSRLGHLLARLGWLVGGPLPDGIAPTGPATVVVSDNAELGGQVWTRVYGRPGHLPQTISSAKRFLGPTGLEEYLGCGLVMRLRVTERSGALVFDSAGFDLEIGRHRLALPTWLTPWRCRIIHRDLDGHRFEFSLALDHPWFGRLIHQVGIFAEISA